MTIYEIMKKHSQFNYWALYKVFLTEAEAIAYLEKMRYREPNAQFQMVENANPWYE